MTQRLQASHRILVEAQVDQAFMFFTPASPTGIVEVRCAALGKTCADALVSYEITALSLNDVFQEHPA